MVASAINNSAGIFLEGGRQYQAANSRIFDAITAAADSYDAMRRQREAQLSAERLKQAERMAEQQKQAMQPEAILAKAIQGGPQSLSPQERAIFEANQMQEAAKVAIQPMTGQAYNPYQAINLDQLGGAPQSPAMGAVMPASPMAEVMNLPPLPQGGAASPMAGVLLPPPVAGQEGDMSVFQGTQTAVSAPPPLGQSKPKEGPKFSPPADSTGVGSTPVGQVKRFEKELEFYSNRLMKDYERGLDAETDAKARNLVERGLQRMFELNSGLKERNALVSADRGLIGNAKTMAKGARIPFVGTEVGRTAEKALDPKTAQMRDEYLKLRSMLFPFYAKASGLSATAIDTEAARQDIMGAMGDPTATGVYDSNKDVLRNVSAAIGTGELAEKKEEQVAEGKQDGPPAPPKPGDVREGWRFKGGNPARKESWEKVK